MIAASASDSINNSWSSPNSQIWVRTANESEIIGKRLAANLNVTLMAYSDDDAEGNERNTHINNTFSARSEPSEPFVSQLNFTPLSAQNTSADQLSSSEISISYSQSFATTLVSNDVNDANDDRVQHKWHNETNETIDSPAISTPSTPSTVSTVGTAFEHNSNSSRSLGSTEADNSPKLFQHNEPKADIRSTSSSSVVPLPTTSTDGRNWRPSSSKLASNVVTSEKSNESDKPINTHGLDTENIATNKSTQVTLTSNSSMSSLNSWGLEDSLANEDNKTKIASNERSVEKQNTHNAIPETQQGGPIGGSERLPGQLTTDPSLSERVMKNESGGDSTTNSPSTDALSTVSSSGHKYAYSTQIVIPDGTDSSMVTDVGHEWLEPNATASMANAIANDSEGVTRVIQISLILCLFKYIYFICVPQRL